MKLGILGGGQLGQMLAKAASALNIESVVLDPKPDAVAGQVSRHLMADYEDADALDELATCDAVTFEFENVPTSALDRLGARVPVRPPIASLEGSNDRIVEKELFQSLGVATAPFAAVSSRAELDAAVREIGLPAVLKTRRFGYDGKGQAVLRGPADAEEAWAELGENELILEGFVDFDREISLLAVRGRDGKTAYWPAAENHHVGGILHISRAPAPAVSETLFAQAARGMEALMTHLDYVGVLVVEFFQQGESLVANEMACRVHNSGHWTIEGAETSQFENHVRAVMGQPLGGVQVAGPSAMLNLIGTVPDLSVFEGRSDVHVHVYGKAPAPGRKLGHVTVLGPDAATVEKTLAEVLEVTGDRSR